MIGDRDAFWKLRGISQEIEAMGHLLKYQQGDALQSEDVQAGVGEILERLGRRIRRISSRLEQTQIDAEQKRLSARS